MVAVQALLVLLSWKGLLGQYPGYEINVPRQVKVQEGLCVIIPCNFSYLKTHKLSNYPSGYWFKGNVDPRSGVPVASYIGRKKTMKETMDRFKIVGDVRRDECSLSIQDARKHDTGKYYFRIDSGDLQFNYKDTQPFLDVQDLSEQPEFLLPAVLTAGTPVNVTCTAPGRCAGTDPVITWEGNIQPLNSVLENVLENANGDIIHSSRLTFTPSSVDQEKSLTCVVRYPAVNASTQKMNLLNIESSDQVTYLLSNCTALSPVPEVH
ncbi:sialic acid-binding Ig-like lectin 12 isoform X1 [Rhinatrema bivittatum]|uniref:sialic acid-binding Ig-like lectin 12 isoform X1 n=1 Tax=Rhinatrema bivittatum TaxID=194408 RepID=UPI0011270BED|nr:sialic acid-binding Ig-like lectin 12 isoform X1 [Rhinatrema bivittatum]